MWSSYLGGEDTDDGRGIAVDSSGACYVTGSTNSHGWVSGGWDTTHLGIYDEGFVVKLNSTGGHEWSTYLGGLNADYGYDIAVDSSGACFVTGSTASSCWLSGGWDTSLNGSADGFVVKLTTTGEHEWSSFVGGTSTDYGFGIAVDLSGSCYVTGRTASPGWIGGGGGLSGSDDGFIVKLNGAGIHQWSAYLGGTAYDCGWGIATDSSGAYITGSTESSGWISEGWQPAYFGNGDAFVLRTKPQDTVGNLQVILTPAEAAAAGARWRRVGTDTWLNSGDTETGILSGRWDIEFKNIEGWAAPGVHAVSIPADDTATDTGVYVMAVPWDTTWSTYLGGTGKDGGTDIAVDSNGACYVTGYTASSGWTSGGGNTLYGCGAYNAYVVKLNSAGGHEWSTYLDGTGEDEAYSIAVDSNGGCYVAGVSDRLLSTSSGFVAKLNSAGGQEWFEENGVDTTYVAVDASSNYYKTVHHNHYLGYPPQYHGHIYGNGCSWSTAAAEKNYYNLTVGASGSVYVVSEDYNGSYFLEKFSSGGAYQWSTGLNGIEPLDVAVDSSGACYVAGYNSSVYFSDGYLNKYTSGGVLLWSKHWGGTGKETANGLALDGSDNCYVTGLTSSSGWTSGGWDTSLNGGTDGYVVKFNSEGVLLWSSYFGGTGSDDSYGIAVDPTGEFIWVTGLTYSSGTMLNGWQTAYGGNGDAFAAQFQVSASTPIAPSNSSASAIGRDTITWTWQDNSVNETGFKVYADEGNTAPLSVTWTTPANATSWTQDLLAVNSPYSFQVCATNKGGDSAKTPNYTSWTLAAVPNAPLVSNATFVTLDVAIDGGDANPTYTDYAIQCATIERWVQADGSLGDDSMWQTADAWGTVTVTGLDPGTDYTFAAAARNGAGVATTPGAGTTRSTLGLPVEGEGEILPEGEGETPTEGEGPIEGEGEILPEGEGEGPIEGEGETPTEGEGPIEGEGELPTEGEGEILPEGEGETLPEGEGELPTEGEGETLLEGEGETPVEGEGEILPEGELPTEGEGEVTVEGEGEILPEGEGEIPPEGEGEIPAEGEGEIPAEGEGEVPLEGEGEIPPEGEGEILPEGELPTEGEGEVTVEGEGEAPPEGEGELLPEGEAPPEGEGEVTVEGEGETPTEGEGEIPPEGEGEILPEGEGEILPEGEGETPPEGEGETLPEGEGEILPEGEGEIPSEGEGEILPEGEGETPTEGEGEIASEGEGETPTEGEGETPTEGEGEIASEGEGETLPEGEGEVPAEGEGEVLPEGEGETPPEGEGELSAEGEGEILPEGEGEILPEGEGEGEMTFEGEGEDESDACGCCNSSSTKTLLGDWLMIGLAFMMLAAFGSKSKR